MRQWETTLENKAAGGGGGEKLDVTDKSLQERGEKVGVPLRMALGKNRRKRRPR